MTIQKTLRFGFIGNPKKLAAWQSECLRILAESGFADLALAIVPEAGEQSSVSGHSFASSDSPSLAFGVLLKMCLKASLAMRPLEPGREPSVAMILSCRFTPDSQGYASLQEEVISRIRRENLDFILLFDSFDLRGAILDSARHGIWSFQYGDETKLIPHGAPGFWEILRADPISCVSLMRHSKEWNHRTVLYAGRFPTAGDSWCRNMDQLLLGSLEWPLRLCRDILNGSSGYLGAEDCVKQRPIHSRPTNWQTLQGVFSMGVSFVRKQLKSLLVRDQWHVGVVQAPIHSFLSPGKRQIAWLPDLPRTRFLADPFGWQRESELAILFEEFDQIKQVGNILAVQSTDGGRTFSVPRPLEGGLFTQAYLHKSYPYLLEHDGQVFCVPETCNANQICLHRAVEFPYKWELDCVLLEGVPAIDTTLFQRDGLWWMFYTTLRGGSNVKLYLAFAPDLRGPWTNHPANPVKTDVASARPGGTPFLFEGDLYRPAQDSTRTYGGNLVINKIDRLSVTEYQEHVVCRLEPERQSRYAHGFHTLAAAGNLTIVDGKRFVLLPELLPIMLRAKLRAAVRRLRR